MFELRKNTSKDTTVYTIALFRYLKLSLFASTVNGAHVSFDIAVFNYGVTLGLNSWKTG